MRRVIEKGCDDADAILDEQEKALLKTRSVLLQHNVADSVLDEQAETLLKSKLTIDKVGADMQKQKLQIAKVSRLDYYIPNRTLNKKLIYFIFLNICPFQFR